MTTTSNYNITLLEQAQAQKEVTINQALMAIDALISNSVADKDLATPPDSPIPGMMYIIAASPTGAWAGKATQLTYFDQIWRFIVPRNGQRLWVADERTYYTFIGTTWAGASGTVNVATGATSLVVTNALCSPASIVFAAIRSSGTTAVKNVVPGAGSFTINFTVAVTVETSIGFFIIN